MVQADGPNSLVELSTWEEQDGEHDDGYREYQALAEAEVRREWRANHPVLNWMHAVSFLSRSRGRGRRLRRYPREVFLLQWNGDGKRGCWRYWSGEDRDDNGRNPWDSWVTEVFGRDFCERLSDQGVHASDYLREQVVKLLVELGGRF